MNKNETNYPIMLDKNSPKPYFHLFAFSFPLFHYFCSLLTSHGDTTCNCNYLLCHSLPHHSSDYKILAAKKPG